MCWLQIRFAYLAEHILLMPIPPGQAGHAKETSPGRRGQVEGDCIRIRWQIHGTAAVPPHGGVGGRFEANGFVLHRLSMLGKLLRKVLHKMQSNRKRTDKGNPVA